MYTIKETIKQGTEMLKNTQDKPILMSRLILQFVLKKEKEYLILHDEELITVEDYNKFIEYINKLNKGIPIQYITNEQEFMKLKFYVDENVLIPQPDTEILVENVLNLIDDKKVELLDLCTGSGAIAVSIAKYSKNAKVIGTDVSKEALKIARLNRDNNNAQVEFILSDMFENLKNKKFDFIVSNPPYIKTAEIENLSDEVKNEPHLALDGGQDGLDFYRIIIEEGYKYLNKNGYICLEIGYDQKNEVLSLINKSGKYTDVKCYKDLGGNDRVIIFQKLPTS
ncbi:MAG: peptide chain release factor N(5)-glutamine methyltransferase [Clostridia bacterium]|nr:peptide chain release factor N(5)-glutamine methyltransferase [Clostridia bacterium]